MNLVSIYKAVAEDLLNQEDDVVFEFTLAHFDHASFPNEIELILVFPPLEFFKIKCLVCENEKTVYYRGITTNEQSKENANRQSNQES